jgi:Mg-chelatase subunit ChlD
MSNFAKALNINYTWNGAVSNASPDNTNVSTGRVSLFFKGCRGLTQDKLNEYMALSSKESLLDTFLLAFNLRDCRGGKGERQLGRWAFQWLLLNYPVEFKKVVHLIPEYGRWDDLLMLFPGTISGEIKEGIKSAQNEAVMTMANQIITDRKNMLEGKPCSLCSKWTPTEGDSLDSKFGTFKTLASALGTDPKGLRKTFNTPLRSYLKVVETFMCSGKWESVDYNKVPSNAMKRLKDSFEKHDEVRFKEWKEALKKTLDVTKSVKEEDDKEEVKVKINARQLYPYEIVKEIRTNSSSGNSSDTTILEAQWKVISEETKKLGSLKDAVAVVDTSGSMESNNSLPLDVAVSLGLMISEVVEGDFHGHLINFHDRPRFTVLDTSKSIVERWNTVKHMEWGGSTNLISTFEMILERGKQCKLEQKDMPKKLFIISDMQFNQVDSNFQTNYEKIKELYDKSNYTIPNIVFWNVQGASTDFPVTVQDNGTIMISGFSTAILDSVLKGGGFDTLTILRTTLDKKRYEKVKLAIA